MTISSRSVARRRQQIEASRPCDSSSARNDSTGLEAAVGVAAQHRDEAGKPALDQPAQQRGERLDPLRLDLDEQPLDLIERDQQLAPAAASS